MIRPACLRVVDHPVARIIPTEGAELAGEGVVHAPVVLANADPAVTAGLPDFGAPHATRAQVEIATSAEGLFASTSRMPGPTVAPGTTTGPMSGTG